MRVLKSLIGVLLKLAVVGALMGLIAGAIPSLHPAADSFAHFRLHFAAVMAVALVPLALFWFTRWRRWTAVAALVLLRLAVAGAWVSGPPETVPTADLRHVQFNLNYRNLHVADVMAYIVETDPDFVTLQEVTPFHAAYLDQAATTHPYRRICPFAAVGGVAILSKHPVIEAESGCAEGLGLTWLRVETPKGPVTVASIHTYWPWPLNQHGQIDRMVPLLKGMKTPIIVAGDFNAAPWGHAVVRIAEAARAKLVPGVRITIGVRVFRWLPAVPIPIDHVLVSDELCGLAARVGPKLGSDHDPVIVDIGWVEPGASTGCSRMQ